MKHIGIIMVLCLFFCGFHTLLNAEPQCPEGKYYNPEVGKCVTPGDGDADVDRQMKKDLMAECQIPCGDGWCCWEQAMCQKCQNESGNKKTRCYKANKCWKKTR